MDSKMKREITKKTLAIWILASTVWGGVFVHLLENRVSRGEEYDMKIPTVTVVGEVGPSGVLYGGYQTDSVETVTGDRGGSGGSGGCWHEYIQRDGRTERITACTP